MAEEILGLPLVAMALIVAASGTVLYHLRNLPEGVFEPRKIVDSRLAIFGAALTAAYVSLPEVTAGHSPELQLGAVLAEIGGIAGFSFIAKKTNDKRVARKRAKQSQTIESLHLYEPEKITPPQVLTPKDLYEVPVLNPPDGWIQTNLRRKKGVGAVLDYGHSYLWVRLAEAKTFLTVVLMDSKDNIIQIEQSHKQSKEGSVELCRLEMFAKDGTALPRGAYEIRINGDRGTSYSVGTSLKFDIV